MTYVFHPAAEQELYEAAAYYDEKSVGLGREFILEIFKAVDLVREYPEAAPRISDLERRKLVARFPYGVIYSIRAEEIRILAVMNLKRRPEYWQYRK